MLHTKKTAFYKRIHIVYWLKSRRLFLFFNAQYLQWVGGLEDLEAEYDSIDVNGGGQILFSEFVDWALSKVFDSWSN